MSQLIRISHPELLLFAGWTAPGRVEENSGRVTSWQSEEMETPTLIACTASFDGLRAFNSIQIRVHPDFPEHFPNTFRIDISQDGQVWEPIIRESDFRAGLKNSGQWNFSLITARHIKFLFLADKANDASQYFAAFGELRVMISGVVEVETSSELDRLWVKDNLIDERPEYGWSSALRSDKQTETIQLDLGSVNRVTELRMLSKNDRETFFPEIFQVSYSEDSISWHHLLEENGFLAEPGTWYRWRFVTTNMRYMRLHINEGARTREGKYISQIIELEMYASPELIDKTGKSSPEAVPYASVLRSGLVRLAMDGENREGVVVQGNDRRLRDSTTESRGIVELAADGEERPGVAVQGNDRRLRYASEDLPGILRLARDGEVRSGHALQSTDGRLRPATEETAGLVELASDGENRPGVAVQGNDKRLRQATAKSPGIVRLAEHSSDRPNEAVQGSDPRLRDASVEYPGIMRFARPSEDAPETAVQGNDPRIRRATTEAAGIVELARDGEDRENVVVQGNDRRISPATEDKAGIVELAPHSSVLKGRAVQADDPRLSDAREPREHQHDYAPLVHDFGSHSGTIRLEAELGEAYRSLTEPPGNFAPIIGVNRAGGAGVVGQAQGDGLLGAGRRTGVVGLGLEKAVGVLGAGRKGPGGYFTSERGYSVVAGGEVDSRGLSSSELALLVRGRSRFTNGIYISSTKEQAGSVNACMAAYFEVENSDVVVPGDILVASSRPGVLTRAREAGSSGAIGVVVEAAALVLGHPDEVAPDRPEGYSDGPPVAPAGQRLVALAGIVQIRVVGERRPIRPGDLLVTSAHSGRGHRFEGDTPAPGTIVARSLEAMKDREGVVRAVLVLN